MKRYLFSSVLFITALSAHAATWNLADDFSYSGDAGKASGHATTDVHVSHNGVLLFSGRVNGAGSTQAWNSASPGLVLAAGDRIDVSVGNGGNGYTSDSTGVDVVIRNAVFPH